MEKKILIVDDEKAIITLIRSYLEKEGFLTLSAENGAGAVETVKKESPNLILLDIMLPDISGIDTCLEIRKHTNAPVLFLSCIDQELDKIIALSVGGDDYITKPFMPGELIARIKAHLRRTDMISIHEEEEEIYEAQGLFINATTREVMVDGREVNLTVKEFDILLLLIKRPKRIYSAEQLFEYAWKEESLQGDKNTIMVYISNLRKKIENNENNYKYILSLRGLGYKFNHQLLK